MSESGPGAALLSEYHEKQDGELTEYIKSLDNLNQQIRAAIAKLDRRRKRWRRILGGIAAVAGSGLVWVGMQTDTYWRVLAGELGKALLVAFTIDVGVELLKARTQGVEDDVLGAILVRVERMNQDVSSIVSSMQPTEDWIHLITKVDSMAQEHSDKLWDIKLSIGDVANQVSRVERVTEELAPHEMREMLQFLRGADLPASDLDVLTASRHNDPDAAPAASIVGVRTLTTLRRSFGSLRTALAGFLCSLPRTCIRISQRLMGRQLGQGA